MSKSTRYCAKEPDEYGTIEWTEEENGIWHDLIVQQLAGIKDKACDEFLAGLDIINFPTHRIPQLAEISNVLEGLTGWRLARVAALINFDEFFHLLANKQFPVATFIRSRADFDYLQEPDIFHEMFGHCPLLTHPAFAHFTHIYGQIGLNASKEDRVFLARLYWFTIEFGLLRTPQGLRIYGGGILSSPGETQYSLACEDAQRYPMNVLEVLRTPYRIDILQPIYFIINRLSELSDITRLDIIGLIDQARKLGLHEAAFSSK
jgi:phenylalanine-4-hydroxylase